MDQRVHIVFPQHFSDISFILATRLYCFGFVSLSPQTKCARCPSENDTVRQTTWFCRNRRPKTPAETIPKPCVPLSYWQNLHHGSSAIVFSIPLLLPPFSCVMDAGAAAGVEGVVFAARGAREVLVVGFTRLLANRGLTRKQRPTTPRPLSGTSGRTGPLVPCRCTCGLTQPRLAHLAFGCAGR